MERPRRSTVVTDLHLQRLAAERAACRAEALPAVASALVGRTVPRSELAALLVPAFVAALPFTNVSLVERAGDGFSITVVMNGWGPSQPVLWMRLTPEAAARWAALETHVNQNVADTDIYGDRVMGECSPPPQSLVLASALDPDGEHVATLVATAETRDAFDRFAIEGIEAATRLVGRGLRATPAAAAA